MNPYRLPASAASASAIAVLVLFAAKLAGEWRSLPRRQAHEKFPARRRDLSAR